MAALKPSIGTSTANSYVTEASANSYFEYHYNAQPWTNLDGSTNATAVSTLKAKLLIQATRELDRTFRYHDSKYNSGTKGESNYQALQFPRSTDYDSSGNLYIEDDVKYATYEQALWILQRTMPRRTEEGVIEDRNIIGKDAFNYIKPYITRQVLPVNRYVWQ